MTRRRAGIGVPTVGTWIWGTAALLALHAATRRLGGDGTLVTLAVASFLFGVLLNVAGWRARGWAERILQPLACGAALAVASVPAALLLDGLVEAVGSALAVHAGLLALVGFAALAANGAAGRLRTLLGVEGMKLLRSRLAQGSFGVAVLITLLVGFGHEPVEGESGWAVAAQTVGAGLWAAEILVLVLGATAIAGELGQGTLKMILPHAYRRSEWIAAKSLVLLAAAVLFVVVVGVTGVLSAAGTADLGDVVKVAPAGFGEEDATHVFQTSETMGGHLRDGLLAAVASLGASLLLGMLLSCLFQSVVPALSAALLAFVGLKAGDLFVGLSQATLDHVYARKPDALLQLTENLGRGFNDRWNEALLPDGLYLAMITGVLALLAAVRIFARRDLHT